MLQLLAFEGVNEVLRTEMICPPRATMSGSGPHTEFFLPLPSFRVGKMREQTAL
jgi:hypothetical protein